MTENSNLLWTGSSLNGVPISLTRERWEHILTRHPEMQAYYNQVLETLENPDLIQRDDSTDALLALRFYQQVSENKKFVVVVYLELTRYDGFITTAYLRKQPSSNKRIIWTA